MSLRTLFWMMGLVTTAMIAAVVYFKILTPVGERELSVAEQRSIDRICYSRCEGKAEAQAANVTTEEALKQIAQKCVRDCQTQLSGRAYSP